jgi:hypothetical protein
MNIRSPFSNAFVKAISTSILHLYDTINYTLFSLAAVFGAVCGTELGATIMGVTTGTDPCSADDEDVLYEDCVVDVAIAMGVNLSRRLELRGNRELQT